MVRIMEVFVTLNAIGGILAFLGIRWSARRAAEVRSRLFGDVPPPEVEKLPEPPAVEPAEPGFWERHRSQGGDS